MILIYESFGDITEMAEALGWDMQTCEDEMERGSTSAGSEESFGDCLEEAAIQYLYERDIEAICFHAKVTNDLVCQLEDILEIIANNAGVTK